MADALQAENDRLRARVAELETQLVAQDEAQARQALRLYELTHRVKNTLAAVQSIARLTLRPGRPNEAAAELFTSRLIALSAAHDVLTRGEWRAARLSEIAEEALKPFAGRGERRIVVSGADVRLGPRAALALAMALHELATNAAKYGALSVDRGRVALSWTARNDASGARLELEWRETGGPRVVAPTRRGFGSRLLGQGLASELNGAAELAFEPGGLVCRIAAPLPAAQEVEPA